MELKLGLPQGSFKIENTKAAGTDFIIAAAGGRKPDLTWFKNAAADKKIYCADKGVEICFDSGFLPELFCGDADSAGKDYLKKLADFNIAALLFDKDKDDTDLQLLLKNLPSGKNLLVTGIWGGRFDHLYSNVFSLLAYKLKTGLAAVLADEKEIMVLLAAGEKITFTPEAEFKAVSLLPLKDSVVSIKGTKWVLDKAELNLSNPYAISNEITDEIINIECHSGCIGFYLKTDL